MKIKKIKINSYGKLNNKEINLNNINLIYGKNESGKSTLLNFIMSMFFGINKNKNGKNISDLEKYTPWNNNEEFSGKLEYITENNNEYKIYREFKKKNPEIYDKNDIEISNQFTIDKKNGNQFFNDQFNVSREMLSSTVITEQKEVELDENMQGKLLQKIANITESGDEEISYKSAVNKINKLLLNEVGTEKSQERPLNIAEKNIREYTNKLNELKEYNNFNYQYEENNNKLLNNLKEEENKNKILNEINNYLNNIEKDKNEIIIKNNILNENIKKFNKNIEKNVKNDEKIEKNNKKTQKNNKKEIIFILLFLIIFNLLGIIFINNLIIKIILSIIIPIYFIFIFKINNNNNSTDDTEEKNNEIIIENNLIEKNINDQKNEINILKNKLNEKINLEKNKIINKYGSEVNELFDDNINLKLKINERKINDIKLELHKLKISKENIEPKLEKIIEYKEALEFEKEKYLELKNKAKIFEMTKNILDESYQEMKQNILPKLNSKFNENIRDFTDNKYTKLIVGDTIKVEMDTGKIIDLDSLSTGTIEQVYMALRLSAIDELSKEKLPIILDEAFAYYDDERLEKILEKISKLNNQIIILTCTNRERKILGKIGVSFEYVEL